MNNIVSNIILAIILIITQVLLFSNINFMNSINPFVYLFFIIYYPLRHNRSLFILVGFLYGITIDIFLDTHGIHATATLIVSYMRPFLMKLFFGVSYLHQVVKFSSIEIKQNILYLFTIIFIHHFILFGLDIFDLSKISIVFKNTIYTLLFTFFVVYGLYEILINKKK